jgi:plastocyanin
VVGRLCVGASAAWFVLGVALAQEEPVTIHVSFDKRSAAKVDSHSANNGSAEVAVWLKPMDGVAAPASQSKKTAQLVQRNKNFEPHVLVVEVGSVVDFPNRDPFFHNVFSLFDGKSFDLGLYEAGGSKPVHFDRVGVSFLFCNIHPEMSAAVVAVDTPYYGVSNRAGVVTIPNVPDGRYELHVWSERSLPDDLKTLTRKVTVSSSTRSLASVSIPENPNFTLSHKNKYGQDYVPPPTSGYTH